MDTPTPRRRGAATAKKAIPEAEGGQESAARKDASESSTGGFNFVDILRGLVGLLIFTAAMSWFITGESLIFDYRKAPTVFGAINRYFSGPLTLTDDQLSLYNGTDSTLPIYVGLNGSIFDVSASPHTYGPGGSYSFFSGRDAARAFITGCFAEDLTPDLRGLEEMYIPTDDPAEAPLSKPQLKLRREREARIARKRIVEGLEHWESVFKGETGRPYFYVGKIKREKGWLEKLPKRELCQAAKEGRPSRKDAEKESSGKG